MVGWSAGGPGSGSLEGQPVAAARRPGIMLMRAATQIGAGVTALVNDTLPRARASTGGRVGVSAPRVAHGVAAQLVGHQQQDVGALRRASGVHLVKPSNVMPLKK